MPTRRAVRARPSVFAAGRLFVGLAIAALMLGTAACSADEKRDTTLGKGRVPIAVLGDSDSHSYHDSVRGIQRGGAYAGITYQWTEVLHELRGDAIDFGPRSAWGQRGIVARLLTKIGLPARTPEKNDFHFNFAVSGQDCDSLDDDWPWQGRWLLARLRSDPERWAEGLVVVKIGVNDLGQLHHLRDYARGATAMSAIRRCRRSFDSLLQRIRETSPVAVLLVGVADDSSWPASEVPDWDHDEVARIREQLDAFDEMVRSVAFEYERTAFMDDRAWYYDHWPDRSPDGRSQVGGVSLGGSVDVTNTMGDEPFHLKLTDGHAGTVANGFWANHFVDRINDVFGFGIAPLLPSEIADLADPSGEWGIAPERVGVTDGPVLSLPASPLRISAADLPSGLSALEGSDGAGVDISGTAVAYTVDERGRREWLFGSGAELELRPERHGPGRYVLVVEVRDRSGGTARVERELWIRR